MKIRHLYITLFTAIVATMVASCDVWKDNTSTSNSDNTNLVSMVFSRSDSFPDLVNADFTIELSGDTGLVYNEDSLAYGTKLDSVVTTFVFEDTIGYAVFYSDSDTIVLTKGDTLNFNPRPCRLYVVSSDYEHSKWYKIYVNVHQVDPDLYVWEECNPAVFAEAADVHAEWVSDHLALFTQDGIATKLYTSTDGKEWSGATPAGLPKNANVRQIISAQGNLYYTQDNTLYSSVDGMTWTEQSYASASFELVQMLFGYNDSVWAIVSQTADQKLYMATMAADGFLEINEQIGALSDDFPVSDFSAVTFESKVKRPRVSIIGGYSRSGKSLNTRWNMEWAELNSLTGAGRYNMEDFTIEQPSFGSLTGASVIWYDNELLMFGGVDEKSSVGEYPILESKDEGMNWSVPDSAHNYMPASYQVRQRQSVVCTPTNKIYIIGGQNRTTTFSDVYVGMKNDQSASWGKNESTEY